MRANDQVERSAIVRRHRRIWKHIPRSCFSYRGSRQPSKSVGLAKAPLQPHGVQMPVVQSNDFDTPNSFRPWMDQWLTRTWGGARHVHDSLNAHLPFLL